MRSRDSGPGRRPVALENPDGLIVMRIRRSLGATIVVLAAHAALAGPAPASETLARARNCFACHKIEGKLVGPGYREIAARYAADRDATDLLAKKIRAGGAGNWGTIAMAPNPQVTPADARALAIWVMSFK